MMQVRLCLCLFPKLQYGKKEKKKTFPLLASIEERKAAADALVPCQNAWFEKINKTVLVSLIAHFYGAYFCKIPFHFVF